MRAIFGDKILASDSPSPGYVIFTRSGDAEVDTVSLELLRQGQSYLRIDIDDLEVNTEVSWDLSVLQVSAGGRLSSPNPVIWFRHFDVDSMSLPTPSPSPVLETFARAQWKALERSLWRYPNVINPPAVTERLDRISQLLLADELGIARPFSLVSNSPDEVRSLHMRCDHGLIAKPLGDHFMELSPGELTGLFPARLPTLASVDSLISEPAPVIYQEFLPAEREIRLFLIENTALAYTIYKDDAADLWLRPDSVRVETYQPRPELVMQARQYLSRAGLNYGAFDFLEVKGEYVFLEVNPSGDWRWFEEQAKSREVTEAMTGYLLRLLRTQK